MTYPWFWMTYPRIFELRVGIAQYQNSNMEYNHRGVKWCSGLPERPHPFLWGDGYDPWSQYATSTINFWTLHHHSGCVCNGWRSGGGRHGVSAWGSLPGTIYGKKNLTGILIFFTWLLCFSWLK